MIDTILKEMCTEGTILNEIIKNNIRPHYDYEGPLISELAMVILQQEEKVKKMVEEKWFNYWLIKVIQNQIKSSTSPFHKNYRETIHTKTKGNTIELDMVTLEDESDIKYKEEKEELLELIETSRKEMKVSFFDAEVFKLYYDEGLSYRDIEREYDIDHCLAFNSVKKTREKLINKINKKKH